MRNSLTHTDAAKVYMWLWAAQTRQDNTRMTVYQAIPLCTQDTGIVLEYKVFLRYSKKAGVTWLRSRTPRKPRPPKAKEVRRQAIQTLTFAVHDLYVKLGEQESREFMELLACVTRKETKDEPTR